ncbi:MAG: hypothetical protein ACOC7K_00075, partial [bacterium]
MSTATLPTRQFDRIDLLPGCLMVLCVAAWVLFGVLAVHGERMHEPPRVLFLISVATWVTTGIWLHFLNERKNGPISSGVLLLCTLVWPLLPIAYTVLLLRKPQSERQTVEKVLRQCNSRIEDVRTGAEQVLTTRKWHVDAIGPLVAAIVSGNTKAAEALTNLTETALDSERTWPTGYPFFWKTSWQQVGV